MVKDKDELDEEEYIEEGSKSGGKKEKKKRVTPFLRMGSEFFDPRRIVRIDERDEQDLDSPVGMKFVLIIYLCVYPYELTFNYATPELRARKRKRVEDVLVQFGAVFIDEEEEENEQIEIDG